MKTFPGLFTRVALLGVCATLAACGGGTSSGAADARPATRPMGGAAMLQQVRSAGEVGDELDVQPLRDPRVEDLRASATQAESRGDYATTEEGCPGARRAAFVSGYLPPEHKTCQQGSWLDWFHLGGDGAPPAEPAPVPEQESQ